MTDEQIRDLRFDVPHGARIWNYWLGGKDNYPPDREIGDAVSAKNPEIAPLAVKSRQFLIRVVRFLAGEAGIHQFLDIGTGLPTMQNTHEVAQSVAPEARVVYVDNDPLVLAHARALLTNTSPEGITTYIDADYRDSDRILTSARNVLNFDEPIAVLFMGVLGYVNDAAEAQAIITRLMDAVPPGSYLALWDGTDTSEAGRAGNQAQADLGSPYELRRVDQIRQWFEGLHMVEPDLVTITQWRPNLTEVGQADHVDGYGAVARKP